GGAFWCVTFSRGDALAPSEPLEGARKAFEKMLTYANHVGLYSEEIAATGEQIGNFPQAFTHLSLIDAALTLNAAPHRQTGGSSNGHRPAGLTLAAMGGRDRL